MGGLLLSQCHEVLDLPCQLQAEGAPAERGANNEGKAPWPRYVLKAERTWQLNLPQGERFDASGLAKTSTGELLTVNDRGSTVYRIQFHSYTNSADLIPLPNCFTAEQLRPFAREKADRYDTEGIALDSEGRIYICEEANRWVMRWDGAGNKVERLAIDWALVNKYFDLSDSNASFEGIAVMDDRLFVANERQMGRIVVLDLKTLRILDDFSVRPWGSNARDVHYSDLSVYRGVLYALLRESRCVLAVQPETHQVLAEYDYRDMEREPEVLYRSLFPTGQIEGLAVDEDAIWLVTDNNGTGRARYPTDIRPTLFRCKRMELRGTR